MSERHDLARDLQNDGFGRDEDYEQEHAIEAYYSGGPGEPYYQPVMSCSCGWSSRRQESWEETGRLMDEHIKEIAHAK